MHLPRPYIKIILFTALACLLFLQPSMALIGKYPIKNFSPVEYHAGIQNIDFAQNREMTMFVANNFGVLSYDGKDWAVHPSGNGKKIRALAFDKQSNRLYVGSQGTFGYFESNWDYVSLLEKVPKIDQNFDEVWDVFLVNSKVYFCTFQGIYEYDGTSIHTIKNERGFNHSFFANGTLYTQNQRGQLYKLEGRQLELVYTSQKKEIIAGVIPQEQGLLILHNSGKLKFSTPFGSTVPYNNLTEALQGKYVNHVLQLSDARLVISTQTAGLFIYDLKERTIENITVKDGLQTNACLRAFQDYLGNLWVGMQNGIGLIDINSPTRFINQEINLQGSGYEAFEVEEGTYYTTSNGIYFSPINATKSNFLSGTEGPAYGIQRIAGKLYAGHHTGLFLLESGQAKKVANLDGLWKVKQLRKNPEFVIGGTYSGLYLFRIENNLLLRPIQRIQGFDESSRFFEEDQNGNIWVGQFYKGLYRIELTDNFTNAIVEKVSDNHDLPIKNQIILSRIDNQLYLATKDGIYQLDPITGRITKSLLFAEDIGEQPVYLLAQDDKKNIHVITENMVGFYRQISANNYAFVPSSLYQLRYSFNNDLLNISINTEDGVLFNANEGFISYKPELENRTSLELSPIISKVFSVTEDSILYALPPFQPQLPNSSSILDISNKAKVLQFQVKSFQYNGVDNQQFRYFLRGFDEDYGDWTSVSLKEYTNLREGNYDFLVQTRNFFGEVITSEPLSLKMNPPFERSLTAKLLYLILGFLTLFGIYKLQKRRYTKKTKIVEATKEQELAQKQREIKAIEQQKEQQLLKLEEDKMISEMRHLNNLLAASTMNLVVKNEFMESVKEKLNEVKQMGKNKEAKQALEQIVREIDITLKLQEDWKQFEHHFDKVHGDFLTRLRTNYQNLSPNEQKLCAFLRLNLNTKDIANIMGVSSRGIEVARYRLRKKLELDKGQNLSKFILEY